MYLESRLELGSAATFFARKYDKLALRQALTRFLLSLWLHVSMGDFVVLKYAWCGTACNTP